MLYDSHASKLDLRRMNFSIITLVPKLMPASKIKQFRTTCLLNDIYKIITKVLTLGLTEVGGKGDLQIPNSFFT